MYAVVKTGGKQLKVEVGETVSVELLDAAAGSVVTLPALLVSGDDGIKTGEEAAAVTVTAEVLGHGKADKVLVFSFRKRKGSKKLRGHRQPLTLVKVTDISAAGKAAKAPKAAKAVKAEAPETVEAPKAAKAPKAAAAAKAPAEAAEKPKAARKPAAPKAAKAEGEAKPARKTAAAKADTDAKPAKKPAAKKTAKPADSAE